MPSVLPAPLAVDYFELEIKDTSGIFIQRADGIVEYWRGTACEAKFTPTMAFFALRRGNETVVFSLELAGSSGNMLVLEQPQETTYSFFFGADPEGWEGGLQSNALLRYPSAYPGIDVTFRGTPEGLKYELEVSEGADLSQVVFRYSGVDSIVLDADVRGLTLSTPFGEVRDEGLVAWEAGSGAPVGVEFVLSGSDVSFSVVAHSGALVVDPNLVYSTFLGGSGADWVSDVALDENASVYAVGTTYSTDFPATVGSSLNGEKDAFILKLAPDGSTMEYCTFLGTSGSEGAYGIAVNESTGVAYVTGYTDTEASFPRVSGSYSDVSLGQWDIFVTGICSNGSTLCYGTVFGAEARDVGNDIAYFNGTLYVTGYCRGSDFPITPGAHDGGYQGPEKDAFATVIRPALGGASDLLYSTFIGKTREDIGHAVVVDAYGRLHLAGYTEAHHDDGDDYFPINANGSGGGSPYSPATHDGGEGWVARLDPDGNGPDDLYYCSFVQSIGFGTWESAYGVAVDSENMTYVSGMSAADISWVTAGSFNDTRSGGYEGWLIKVDTSKWGGADRIWGGYIGGTGDDAALSVSVDADGASLVTGWTESSDLQTTSGANQTTYAGARDAFVQRIHPDGTVMTFSSFLGGSALDEGYCIATNDSTVFVGGLTDSSGFPVTTGAFNETHSGGTSDGFVTKMLTSSSPTLEVTDYQRTLDQYENWTVFASANGTDSLVTEVNVTVDGVEHAMENDTTAELWNWTFTQNQTALGGFPFEVVAHDGEGDTTSSGVLWFEVPGGVPLVKYLADSAPVELTSDWTVACNATDAHSEVVQVLLEFQGANYTMGNATTPEQWNYTATVASMVRGTSSYYFHVQDAVGLWNTTGPLTMTTGHPPRLREHGVPENATVGEVMVISVKATDSRPGDTGISSVWCVIDGEAHYMSNETSGDSDVYVHSETVLGDEDLAVVIWARDVQGNTASTIQYNVTGLPATPSVKAAAKANDTAEPEYNGTEPPGPEDYGIFELSEVDAFWYFLMIAVPAVLLFFAAFPTQQLVKVDIPHLPVVCLAVVAAVGGGMLVGTLAGAIKTFEAWQMAASWAWIGIWTYKTAKADRSDDDAPPVIPGLGKLGWLMLGTAVAFGGLFAWSLIINGYATLVTWSFCALMLAGVFWLVPYEYVRYPGMLAGIVVGLVLLGMFFTPVEMYLAGNL